MSYETFEGYKKDSTIISKSEIDITKPILEKKKGLSLCLASVFIVGEMAGSGVLALPRAVADAGWSGIFLIIFCCAISLYAGICLGRSWSILEERYEEYAVKNRHPYAAIAYRAVGLKMSYFVSFCIDVNLLGVGIVFLLLSAQLISSLASNWGISFCYWVLILGAILCPLMWLGTPEDFWPAAIVALGTTLTACVLLIIMISKESVSAPLPEYKPPTILSFFLSYGTILFAFGGAASFPTFQNDMKNKHKFPTAVSIGFIALVLMYLPVASLGYHVYGSSLSDNVIQSLPRSVFKTIVEVLLALHVFFAFLLVCNAPAQDFEEFLNIPKNFGWKRIALRTTMMIGILFVGQTIPRFGKVLNLVGGSFTALTSTVLPCFLYYRLCSQMDPAWPIRNISTLEKCVLIIIIASGVVGGALSTYSALDDIIQPDTFKPPCYINVTGAAEL
ncbi:uncharacterized protein [Parasteatoda tepidariorum]|uniref:uncharacterized protein isoform X3 n=1 Tax=Parasteatoda tepidariorum TaxID=114398 RepID=UPI00077FE13F|nr:amino acid transporter AVT1J-like isoform X3 [Parasteatoda tepidariorum]